MRRISNVFCLLMFLANKSHSQGYGVTAGFATSKAFMFDVFFKQKVSRYHIGLSLQRNGQKGPAKSERLSNYGTTFAGSGDYFLTVDLKYSRVIKNKFTALVETSLGSKKYYTNYTDNRFNAGGYHLIKRASPIAGVGIAGGYILNNGFEAGLGFNTIRGVCIDLVISF